MSDRPPEPALLVALGIAIGILLLGSTVYEFAAARGWPL